MSIWSRIGDALKALGKGESLAAVFDRLRTPPERTVGFTIAVIALGAKMAKADGQVTRNEVTAFRQVFHIPPDEEKNAAHVFNLARQDVAGYDAYARRIANMFGAGHPALTDLLEGLFHIAVADGAYHPDEDAFLRDVADAFGLSETTFRRLRSQFVPDESPDPHDVLGVAPDATFAAKRKAWRALVRETHPDRMLARGVPVEAVKLAERRLIAVNRAWEEVEALHGRGKAAPG